jgi:hypothetical protein
MCRQGQARDTGARETRSGSFSPEQKPVERFFSQKFWSRLEEVRHPIFMSAKMRRFTFSRGL